MSIASEPGSSFYLIRHAEKVLDGSKNPALTADGEQRVKQWRYVFAKIEFDAVYSTDTIRTLNTATPIAEAKDLPVTIHDPRQIDVAEFTTQHRGQSVLIVGHSNTSPALANALLGVERYAELDEKNYGSLYIVDIVGTVARAKLLQFNATAK